MVSETEDWLKAPHGADAPSRYKPAHSPRHCRVGFIGNERHFRCKLRVVLDSQQPYVQLSSKFKHPTAKTEDEATFYEGWHLFFALHEYKLDNAFEDAQTEGGRRIAQFRAKQPAWFGELNKKIQLICLKRLRPEKKPVVQGGQPWELEDYDTFKELHEVASASSDIYIWVEWKGHKLVKDIYGWVQVLQDLVQKNKSDAGEPQPFWAYRPTVSDRDSDDPDNPLSRCTAPKWLRNEQNKLTGYTGYTPWAVHSPIFYDLAEHKIRFLQATAAEGEEYRKTITEIFNVNREHKAKYERAEGKGGGYHVTVNVVLGEKERRLAVPELADMTKVKFWLPINSGVFDKETEMEAEVVDEPGDASFVMWTRSRPSSVTELEDHAIRLSIKPNLRSIERQLHAISKASNGEIFGDKNASQGALHYTAVA